MLSGVRRGEATAVYEMPRCVCWGSEIIPIMRDALGYINIPILKDAQHTSYPHYDVISS